MEISFNLPTKCPNCGSDFEEWYGQIYCIENYNYNHFMAVSEPIHEKSIYVYMDGFYAQINLYTGKFFINSDEIGNVELLTENYPYNLDKIYSNLMFL